VEKEAVFQTTRGRDENHQPNTYDDDRATIRVGGPAGKWKTVDDDNYISGTFNSSQAVRSTMKRY
jgi:hypothetical protein